MKEFQKILTEKTVKKWLIFFEQKKLSLKILKK